MTLLQGVVLANALLSLEVKAQFCTNTCPPMNFGTPVPSLCEGDLATEASANIDTEYSVCHPYPQNFRMSDFKGAGRVTVLSNVYIGCNAGRREAGVFAHVAQKFYNRYGNRTTFITSLKGGATCDRWANMYQGDALQLFPNSTVTPKEMPLTVLDQEYEMRDTYFTTPFGHPSYVVLDGDLRVRHKFIGPCCGYEGYYECTADIATALDKTLTGYLENILLEDGNVIEDGSVNDATVTDDSSTEVVEPTGPATCTAEEDFTEWSACSVTCGSGIQFRWRTVAAINGASLDMCPSPVETRPCAADVGNCTMEGCLTELGETWDVVTVASGFDGARDVAFHPTPGLHLGENSEGRKFHPDMGEEAWVLNSYNHSISIVASLGSDVQTTISRRDRGYYHYMVNATALAFNMVNNSNRAVDRDSFNYFSVCNANANTYAGAKEPNYFMGPTLYDTKPENLNVVNRLGEECGDEEPCFFLHSDMLHEAPDCVGIAHDPEITTAFGNVYFAFDNTGDRQSAQLVRFDFQQPHGPGSMDHSVAAIRRFPEIQFARGPPDVHAGMIVHPTRRELYVAVPGENRIVAVSTTGGQFARSAREEFPIFSNRLPSFEYNIFECIEHREFAAEIQTPSGIALSPDGKILFVAERDTGKILGFEVQSGALLAEVDTGFLAIGGLSFSPKSKVLHFVDEETNTLNAIRSLTACSSPAPSRVSGAFDAEVIRARDAINGQMGQDDFFSLTRDYECVVDPIIPDAVYFDQVHDTGYASDDPDVQAMAGMDETAALLANRTDCGATSELNFDQLLLGGYYCHQCLPMNSGAECDAGGVCTNIQWLGYYCDNEYYIVQALGLSDSTVTTSKQVPGLDTVSVTTSNKTLLEDDVIILEDGVTYRFTVQLGEKVVCVHNTPDASSVPLSLPGNDGGCASSGPLLLTAGDDLPENMFLYTSDGLPVVALANEAGYAADESQQEPIDAMDTIAPSEPLPVSATESKASPIVSLIVGAVMLAFSWQW